MALFAAYAERITTEENKINPPETKGEWLSNSSFESSLILDPLKSITLPKSDNIHVAKASTSGIKQKKSKTKIQEKAKVDEYEGIFRIDRTRNKEFLTVPTISRPSAPRYKVYFKMYNIGKHHKKHTKRYYELPPEAFGDDIDPNAKLTKKDLEKPIVKDENCIGIKEERDISRATGFFNRKLTENPNDIDTWLKYVKFQDSIFQFEKSFRKGSFAKGVRVTAERKLAIIDKALTQNADSEMLMRERLHVAVDAYPADELQVQLKKLVEKESGNIIWWQGYIEATQCSMSHCNIPATVQLYTKCLSTLHQLRRNSTLEKAHLEENILRMLYQCGLFLKQSGLSELLWTLLRLYLELNLAPTDKNKFNIGSNVDGPQLVELEEVVLRSQLPIHELWLRIERLREASHWLPFLGNDICEDPQVII